MGLLSKGNAVEALARRGFVVSRAVIEPTIGSPLPGLYLDEPSRRWAVQLMGCEPAIFDYEDVIACQIVERRGPAQDELPKGADLLQRILVNPSSVSRGNISAAKRCPGMGVVVSVRLEEGGCEGERVGSLQFPVITHEMRRDSRLFRQMMRAAEDLKGEFDAMMSAVSSASQMAREDRPYGA